MDSLDEFERSLAEEKNARAMEHGTRNKFVNHRKHRHHDTEDHQTRLTSGKVLDDRQHKLAKRSSSRNDLGRQRDHEHSKRSIAHEDLPILNGGSHVNDLISTRDPWMVEGALDLEFDFSQKVAKGESKSAPARPDYDLQISKHELSHHLHDLVTGRTKLDDIDTIHEVPYVFGDVGSQWRMTKLKAVYKLAEESGTAVDDIAIERFGDLRSFDDAREEQIEMDRRRTYGQDYSMKEKPSGELFKQRKTNSVMTMAMVNLSQDARRTTSSGSSFDHGATKDNVGLDASALNRMKARLLKAEIKKDPAATQIEKEYHQAMAYFSKGLIETDVVVLGQMENRMLAGVRGEVKTMDTRRGRERGLVEDNEDMSIDDMVREERRTRDQRGGEGMRAAERIAKDTKFDTSLDYADENASKLAKRVQRSANNLRNTAVSEFQKMNRILDNCQLCHHEDRNMPPVAPLISLATRVFLTLPTEPELSEGGAVIVPIQHRSNLLECDDDEWEEIRNFMKCLTRMYHEQGREVMFYENAAAPHRRMHAAMQVVALPYDLGKTAPAFFKEAILSSDEEWTQHKKIIDTGAKARDKLGKQAFRRSIAKEMPYFHAWFDIDGGLGHIVEDLSRWPKGDLFARETIGGMLDIEPDVIKRQGRWNHFDKRSEGFKERWRRFDWTKVLTDG